MRLLITFMPFTWIRSEQALEFRHNVSDTRFFVVSLQKLDYIKQKRGKNHFTRLHNIRKSSNHYINRKILTS